MAAETPIFFQGLQLVFDQPGPEFFITSPVNAAMMDAYIRFHGRDRRRIKREVNKAIKLVRRQNASH